MEWENYLESERSIRDSKINKLNENIKKQKQSYLLFMQKLCQSQMMLAKQKIGKRDS